MKGAPRGAPFLFESDVLNLCQNDLHTGGIRNTAHSAIADQKGQGFKVSGFAQRKGAIHPQSP